MFRGINIAILLCFTTLFINAQSEEMQPGYDNGTNLNVLYRNDVSGKLYAHTRGYGFLFRKAKHVTNKSRSYYEIDLQSLKHPKEIKSQGEDQNRRRYVYGKIKSVALLRAAFGLQNVMFYKADTKAVEIRYSYSLGPTVAFAKPYYVWAYITNGQTTQTSRALIKFDEENFTQEKGRITGRAPFSYGLSELQFYPAVTGKFNLSFEYAPYTNLIRAIETGITVDYFPNALQIMARNKAENIIITLNVGFVFGRKWF